MQPRFRKLLAILAMLGIASFVVGVAAQPYWPLIQGWINKQYTRKITKTVDRPYGMAPVAFEAFLRACNNARVHPWRLNQAIGDHPRSVGYHRRDGVVMYRGQKYDYTTAIDIETSDLNREQIFRLVEKLGEQGFAAFYREGPRWRNGEHIHGVYAGLKMKWQLQGQVREWVAKRRSAGKKPFTWQKKFRRYWA